MEEKKENEVKKLPKKRTSNKKSVENKDKENKIEKNQTKKIVENKDIKNKSKKTEIDNIKKIKDVKKNNSKINNKKNTNKSKVIDSKVNKLIAEQLESINRIEEIDKIQKKKKMQNKIAKQKIEMDKQKIANEIESVQKMPKEYKSRIKKKIYTNTLSESIITMYYICLIMGNINIPELNFIKDMQVFSLLMLTLTIILFEKSYNKADDEIAIKGIEMLFISIITLLLIYVCILYNSKFVLINVISIIITNVYYIIKSLVVAIKERIKWKSSISDVRKIVSES